MSCLTCAQGLAATNSRRERKVHWVSFLGDGGSLDSLGLLVSFACRSALDNRDRISGVFTRRAEPPTHKNTQKYKDKYGVARTKIQIHKSIQIAFVIVGSKRYRFFIP